MNIEAQRKSASRENLYEKEVWLYDVKKRTHFKFNYLRVGDNTHVKRRIHLTIFVIQPYGIVPEFNMVAEFNMLASKACFSFIYFPDLHVYLTKKILYWYKLSRVETFVYTLCLENVGNLSLMNS